MPKTIMIVDDEPDIRHTVKEILKKQGYRIITAIDGDDCLKKLDAAKKNPDLILLDIMMPGTPVREVVKKIKGIKIAYLSVVRTSEAEKERLMTENVVDFIQKPFSIDTLIKKVDTLVGTVGKVGKKNV